MLLLQDSKSSEAYKAGYEFGYWVGKHPIISLALVLLFLVFLIWAVVKVIKQIRTFGE